MAEAACVFTEIGFIVLSGWCRPLFPSRGKASAGGAAAGKNDRQAPCDWTCSEHAPAHIALQYVTSDTCAASFWKFRPHPPVTIGTYQAAAIHSEGRLHNKSLCLIQWWVQCTTQRGVASKMDAFQSLASVMWHSCFWRLMKCLISLWVSLKISFMGVFICLKRNK